MKIRAATLAGGAQNQDAYIIGDNFAGVFDGASNHSNTKNGGQNAVWYVHTLAQAVKDSLSSTLPLEAAVHEAIAATAQQFRGTPAECPTSTVALARWSDRGVETYVLGDSYIILMGLGQHARVISDLRMQKFGDNLRQLYRKRLRASSGFDKEHHAILEQLQIAQLGARNVPGGYWIAGSDPDASAHGLKQSFPRDQYTSLMLATDGGITPRTYGLLSDFDELSANNLFELLRQTHAAEENDSEGLKWPRSKRHDDKTLVFVDLKNTQGFI